MPDTHRTPVIAETVDAEITTAPPQVVYSDITNLFRLADLNTLWQTVWTGTFDVPYEAVPASDVDGTGTLAIPTRRILGHTQVLYRSDDLTRLLPFNQLESLALPGESYRLALTPSLLTGVFGASVSNATLTEGGYVQLVGGSGWWIPSGRIFYSPSDSDTPAQELASAQANFFLPRRSVDPFGAITRVDCDLYNLLPAVTTDAVGNVSTAATTIVSSSPFRSLTRTETAPESPLMRWD